MSYVNLYLTTVVKSQNVVVLFQNTVNSSQS